MRPTAHPKGLTLRGDVSETRHFAPLAVIPGIRVEDEHVELPLSVLMLEPVKAALVLSGVAVPSQERHVADRADEGCFDGLRPYQKDGARFLLANGYGICGDQLGLGKTRLALAISLRYELTVVVTPKFLTRSWLNELEALRPDDSSNALRDRVYVCEGTEVNGPRLWEHQPQPRWIFCHYDLLYYWLSTIRMMRPDAIIFDEAHLLKGPKSKRTQTALAFATHIPHRYILTGTAMPNRPQELWSLLQLASGDKSAWGNLLDFRRRYCGAYHDGYHWVNGAEPTNVDELKQRMAHLYVRRTYEDVGFQLPPISRQLVEVELTGDQLIKARQALAGYDMRAVVDALLGNRATTETLGYLDATRKLATEGKVKATVHLAEAILQEQEAVVVFCWMRHTADQLSDKIYKCDGRLCRVHGAMSPKDREVTLDLWRHHGGALVATYGALGVGENLQQASAVILHDLDYVPATMLQAEGRVWRGGQMRPVTSYWMVARPSIDELIAEILLGKSAVADRLLDIDNILGRTLADFVVQGQQEELVARTQRWMEAR